MMLVPFLVKRFTRRAPTVLTARVVVPMSALTRRTFLTTTQLQFAVTPTAHAARAKKEVGKKTTSKDSSTGQRGRKPKAKKTAVDTKPKNPSLKQLDLPPKKPTTPYTLFYVKYLQKHPIAPGSTRETFLQSARTAAAVWKSYTDVEKQPFYDEYQILSEQYKKDVDEYWKNMSLSKQIQLNKALRAKGKFAVHRPSSERRPASPFIRFLAEFRESDEGRAIMNEKTVGTPMIKTTTAASERWRGMSEVEKFPYYEASRRAREEYKQKQAQA